MNLMFYTKGIQNYISAQQYFPESNLIYHINLDVLKTKKTLPPLLKTLKLLWKPNNSSILPLITNQSWDLEYSRNNLLLSLGSTGQ